MLGRKDRRDRMGPYSHWTQSRVCLFPSGSAENNSAKAKVAKVIEDELHDRIVARVLI
jgi:hypothetical protein